MSVCLITDSAFDLPKEIEKEYGIEVMPMQVTLDGVTYFDRENIDSGTVARRMREGALTKTSLVDAERVGDCLERHAKAKDEVIYISFSSGLSGSYNYVRMCAEETKEKYPDFKITVIDSKCASLGEGLVVYLAAKDLANGAGYGELVKKIRYYCDNMEHIFTIDTFEYLYRGGRVSRTVKVVGGLLGIKPILHVDEEGHLVPIEKTKGRKKAFERMVEIAGELCKNIGGSLVGINHFDDPAAAEELKAMLSEKYGCSNFLVSEIGSAIGAHSGPGTVSIYFISD